MKNISTTIELTQGGFYHKITVETNQNADFTTGQIIGKLAQRFYYNIGMAKMLGNGKGIDLRKPFDITLTANNIQLFNTATITEETRKARITVGLTKRGQCRFAHFLALSFSANFDDLIFTTANDLKDENNCIEKGDILAMARAILDVPYTDIVNYKTEKQG
jgi:hypothetical protein